MGLMLCLGLGASATACSPPVIVDTLPPMVGTQPVVAVSNGGALAAWDTGSKVRVSQLNAGVWSAPSEPADGRDPNVALSSSGRGFVVYVRDGSGYARVRDGGVWGNEALLGSGSGAADIGVGVAANAAGSALAAWASGTVGASLYAGGRFWPAASLGTGGGSVAVAMNDSGVGAAAWCADSTLEAARYDPVAGWAPPATLRNGCCADSFLGIQRGFDVGITETGNIIATGAGARVCALRYTASTGWVGKILANGGGPSSLAVGRDGRALLAWTAGGNATLSARLASPSGSWGPVTTLDSGVDAFGAIGAGLGSTGYGSVSYTKSGNLHFVVYNADTAAWGTPGLMEELPGAAYYLSVGFDPTAEGSGVTIWHQAHSQSTGLVNIRASSIGL
jgi:hypothetical protein